MDYAKTQEDYERKIEQAKQEAANLEHAKYVEERLYQIINDEVKKSIKKILVTAAATINLETLSDYTAKDLNSMIWRQSGLELISHAGTEVIISNRHDDNEKETF